MRVRGTPNPAVIKLILNVRPGMSEGYDWVTLQRLLDQLGGSALGRGERQVRTNPLPRRAVLGDARRDLEVTQLCSQLPPPSTRPSARSSCSSNQTAQRDGVGLSRGSG
jgi:hypothetical protein